jgi:hypothetical protein
MRFLTTFFAGLLLIGTLALTPDSSFARGGGYYDDNDSSDVQPAPSDVAPDESMSLRHCPFDRLAP